MTRLLILCAIALSSMGCSLTEPQPKQPPDYPRVPVNQTPPPETQNGCSEARGSHD